MLSPPQLPLPWYISLSNPTSERLRDQASGENRKKKNIRGMESCAGLQVTLCNDNEWTLPPLLFTFLRNPPSFLSQLTVQTFASSWVELGAHASEMHLGNYRMFRGRAAQL